MIEKKSDIFTAARQLFYEKGFKDTNVSDIAENAGIGVGTFYNYYSSKEELFLEIYIKENEDQKKHLMETVEPDDDPVKFVIKFVAKNITEMNSNKILREWNNRELFGKLEKHFMEKGGIKSIEDLMRGGMSEMIKSWKSEGRLRKDLDDEMIYAIFSSIPYIDLHKSEIGIQYFPQVLLYITEFVMRGLTERTI